MSAPTSTEPGRRFDRGQLAHLVAFATIVAMLVAVLTLSGLSLGNG